MDVDEPVAAASEVAGPAHVKRTRILLSCAPCRASKLKCDRAAPCSNCLKKGRARECAYAPKREKPARPAKSMAARLRRLEGMVRDMIDEEGDGASAGSAAAVGANGEGGSAGGQVVQGDRSTTYVGATHFMAMLDDIQDLKGYFDSEALEAVSPGETPEADSPELVLLSKGVPRSKQELLALLPDKEVTDRLIMRYFSSNSPSQHTVHRPAFVRQYSEFIRDPLSVDIEWLALLFMVLALGVFFSAWSAPHELQSDSPTPAMDRFRQYRAAAGWALVASKYSRPGPKTLQPFMLYVEAEFLINRASQTTCWLLSSVCIRIMLKMGLHRDPSKLANISPFDGEMRRRVWNLAIQIDLIVSFHMGLPSMIHGIESDCTLPRNIVDEDFDEGSAELPVGRPDSEYTHMSYPIFKSIICRVFGQVARQAHALTVPPYSEVVKMDALLQAKWAAIPAFMKARPLAECVADPPIQIVQRFGLASLYQKSRCVLHRRYLVAEAPPRGEHAPSRRACLDAALALLGYQDTIFRATQPGGLLAQTGWFVTGLAMHDFLLAAMVVYLVVQSDSYSEVGGDYDWVTQDTPLPDKAALVGLLKRSRGVWAAVAEANPDVRKATGILDVMLRKIDARMGGGLGTASGRGVELEARGDGEGTQGNEAGTAVSGPMSGLALSSDNSPSTSAQAPEQVAFTRQGLMPNPAPATGFDSWIPMTSSSLDWASVDDGLRAGSSSQPPLESDWMEPPLEDLDFMAAGFWNEEPQ